MAPRTSTAQLVVVPLESSVPPEMTLYEWRHRKMASSPRRRTRARRMAPPFIRFADRAA